MRIVWAASCVVLCALLLLMGVQRRAEARFKALHWPRRLGYFGFKRRVVRYMRQTGWTVDTKPWVPIDFLAGKGKQRVVVVLLPSDAEVTPSRIRDLSGISFPFTKGRQMVCITMDAVPQHFIEEGARKGVRIVYYKELDSLLLEPGGAHG